MINNDDTMMHYKDAHMHWSGIFDKHITFWQCQTVYNKIRSHCLHNDLLSNVFHVDASVKTAMETTKSYDTIYLNDLYMVPQEDVPTHVPQIYYVNEISSADQVKPKTVRLYYIP